MSRFRIAASVCAVLWLALGHNPAARAGSSSLIDLDASAAPADDDGTTLAGKPGDSDVTFDSVDLSLLGGDSVDTNLKNRNPKVRSADDPGAIWSRTDKPNGSAAVTVRRNVSPFLDTKVGADMDVATQQPPTTPDSLLPNASTPHSGGSAWASLTGPGLILWDKTDVEARVNPGDDQGNLKTSISKSLPLWENRFSLTLRNDYSLTQHEVPRFDVASTRSVDVDRSARLGYKDTGTSLIVGQSLSSSDERWLNKFGAEQALPGGVSITATVRERDDGAADKGIGASFKKNW